MAARTVSTPPSPELSRIGSSGEPIRNAAPAVTDARMRKAQEPTHFHNGTRSPRHRAYVYTPTMIGMTQAGGSKIADVIAQPDNPLCGR